MKRLLVMLVLVASSAHGEIYTWADSRGAAHYTNRLDEIPVRYRTRAKSLNYGEEPQPGASSAQRNDPIQPVKPAEQAPVQRADGNLMRNAPPQPGSLRPEELRHQKVDRREIMKAKRRKASGQHEE
jgi:hypothetical protein